VTNTYNLYIETLQEGRQAVKDGLVDANLAGACRSTTNWWTGVPLPANEQIVGDSQYIVRSWMAVLTYLLSDYKFLYE
jgi:hypothetical protein